MPRTQVSPWAGLYRNLISRGLIYLEHRPRASQDHVKYPVAFDEFPEVVGQPYLEDQASGPRETPPKFLAFEPGHKEVVFDHVHKEAVPGFNLVSSSTSQDATYPATAAGNSDGRNPNGSQSRIICGLAARKFWIVLLLVAAVVAAAVGGGVGGSTIASRAHQGSSNETSAESTSSSTPAVTDQPTSSTTSSSLRPEPTFLNNQPQDFAFQPFEQHDYKGQAIQPIKSQGPFHLSFNSSSHVWQQNGTYCCVTMCKQFTWTGWWCSTRFQPNASGTFDNGTIGCTGDETVDTSKTKCSS